LSAGRADEISALQKMVKQLTTALQQGADAAAASAAAGDVKNTWAYIVDENCRLRVEKSALATRLNEVQISLSEENKQLSKMVWNILDQFCERELA